MKPAPYLIAKGPVNWTESLANYYADDKQKREKHAQQVFEADQEALRIRAKESPIALLTDVAKFSSSVYQLKEARKKAKAQQEVKDTAWVESRKKLLVGDELEYHNLKQEKAYAEKKGLTFKNADRFDELQKALTKNGHSQASQELDQLNPRRQVILNEMLGHNAAAGMTTKTMLDDFKDNPGEWKELKDKMDGHPNGAHGVFKEYQIKKLGYLELSPEALSGVLGSELSRQAKTAKGIGQANQIQTFATGQDLYTHTVLEESLKSQGSFEKAVFAVREHYIKTQTGPNGRFAGDEDQTGTQKVDAYLKASLIRLGKDGYVTTAQLQPYINKEIRHPAGKGKDGETTIGEIFYSKEDINKMVDAAEVGQSRHYGVLQHRARGTLATLLSRKAQGEDIEQELQLLKNSGLLKDEEFNAIDRFNVANQSQEAYNRENDVWGPRIRAGNLVKFESEAKLIENGVLKGQVQGLIAHHKERRKTLGYAGGKSDREFIRAIIMKAHGLTLGDDEPLVGRHADLENDLLAVLRETWAAEIEQQDDNGDYIKSGLSWKLVNKQFTEYLQANGLFDEPSQNPTGLYGATAQGEMPNYTPFVNQQLEAEDENRKKLGTETARTWTAQTNTAYNLEKQSKDIPGTTRLERVLNIPESVLAKEDILGFLSSGILSDEIMYKSRQLGIPPSTLIRKQLKALQVSAATGDLKLQTYLKNHDLDDLEIPPGPDEVFFNEIEKLPDKQESRNMKFLLNRVSMSPNQNQRLLTEMALKLDKGGEPKVEDQKWAQLEKKEQQTKLENIPDLPVNTPRTQQELQEIEDAERRKILEEEGLLPIQPTEYKPPNIG